MGDPHQVIIDHIGQEVGGQTVVLHQHLHVHAVPRNLDIATQHVRHHADTFAGHLHADHMRLACRQTALDLFITELERTPVIAGRLATGHLFGAHLIQLLRRAKAIESVTGIDQFLGIARVDFATLALPIWAMRTTDIRTFVPLDSQPAQGIEDLLLGLTGRTQLIGVFDTQNEFAAVLLGEAVVEQSDVGGANMGVAGRRWRDARANGGHGQSRTKDETKTEC